MQTRPDVVTRVLVLKTSNFQASWCETVSLKMLTAQYRIQSSFLNMLLVAGNAAISRGFAPDLLGIGTCSAGSHGCTHHKRAPLHRCACVSWSAVVCFVLRLPVLIILINLQRFCVVPWLVDELMILRRLKTSHPLSIPNLKACLSPQTEIANALAGCQRLCTGGDPKQVIQAYNTGVSSMVLLLSIERRKLSNSSIPTAAFVRKPIFDDRRINCASTLNLHRSFRKSNRLRVWFRIERVGLEDQKQWTVIISLLANRACADRTAHAPDKTWGDVNRIEGPASSSSHLLVFQ
ncbi:hypothetical protein ACLOJK_036048 [Asimina triloba]